MHPARRKRRRCKRLLDRVRFTSRCLMGLALCAALAWGGNTLYRWVREAAYFRLRTVQIVGNQTLTRDDIVYLLALPAEVTLWQLDLTRMGARLKHHPYVKTVTLRRQFPGTLRIAVQERSPYLVTVAKSERMVLDAEGVVLRPFTPQHDSRLPQLRLRWKRTLTPGMHLHQEEVQRALELVRTYQRSPVATVMHLVSLTVEDSGASVWEVEPYAFAIRFGEGKVAAQLRRLPPVLRYIVQQDLAVRLVDVSYRQRVVVTLVAS